MEQSLSASNDLFIKPTLSHNQIQAVRVLQYPAPELQQYLMREMNQNPALEGEERELCPVCHFPIGLSNGQGCDCANVNRQKEDRSEQERAYDGRDDWDMSMHSVKGAGSFDDDDDDPLARVSGRAEYGQGILMALRSLVAPDDHAIAEYIIGCLDSHGLLPQTIVDEVTYDLNVEPGRVEAVIAALQRLDPPGIGARTPREALLIQLSRLREAGQPRELAERLLRDHFADLAAKHFREIAREINVAPRVIEMELNFIAQKLHPFPAHGFDPDLAGMATGAPPVRPDVVMRKSAHGFEADIVERRRWNFKISDSYRDVRNMMKRGEVAGTSQERDHVRRSIDDATNLISALTQRWQTMQRVADALIQLQRDYLERGPAGLRPLTRKHVGDMIGLHESTVSRATDGKFVLLPNGKTVPFDDFFNDSLQVKDAILEIIETEDPRHPYSDEQLVALLTQRGMEVARRTIAKYREEIGVLPSRLRRNRLAGVRQPARVAAPVV